MILRETLRLALCAVFMFVCLPNISLSADIKKGVEAYRNGDYKTALQEWMPIAEQGNADAQFSVGLIFDRGLNVIPDYKAAVKWFTLASKQGHIFAQANLGWKYHKGQGVEKDNIHAYKWWNLAANDGHQNAPHFLSVISQRMTQDEIALAHSLARKCLKSGFQECR